MNRLMIAALLLALSHPASACRLSILPGLLQGRVAGVTLAIHGVAVSVASIKPGWALSITNDPSWETSVTGYAIVGAAFLAGPDFLSMLTFSPEPGLSCNDVFNEKNLATVTLTFYRDDRLVRTHFKRNQFGFIP